MTCPETVLVEIAGAITRRVEDGASLAREAVARLGASRTIRWEKMDRAASIRVAIGAALRGMDAIVAAHAAGAGATLVSLDDQILKRAPSVVPTVRPEKILAET